jgi:hypothetical protein
MHNNKTIGTLSCKKIGDMFGPPTAHTEPMRGSLAENEAYCSKEDSYETSKFKLIPRIKKCSEVLVLPSEYFWSLL